MARSKEGSDVTLRRRLMLTSGDIAYDAELLRKLCHLKARPKAIQYFLEGRPTKFTPHEIQKVYREVTSEPGKRGLPPSISDRCIGTTPESRLHTTYIGKKFSSLSRPEMGIEILEAYIKTYEHYLQDFSLTVDDALISFDAAFTIMRALEIGHDVGFVKCEFCRGQFLHPLCTPIHFHSCPTCALIRTKDPQWGYRSKKQKAATEATEVNEQVQPPQLPATIRLKRKKVAPVPVISLDIELVNPESGAAVTEIPEHATRMKGLTDTISEYLNILMPNVAVSVNGASTAGKLAVESHSRRLSDVAAR